MLVVIAASVSPAFAEDAIIPPGRDVVVNVDEPHLLTPVSAARLILGQRDELAESLRQCAKDREKARANEAKPTNWGMEFATHTAALMAGVAIGVWGATR